jgi:hypothetical protein
MRIAGVVAALGLFFVPAAPAKFAVSLTLSPDRPRAGVPVLALVRADARPGSDCALRLLAVAPGVDRYTALGVFINGSVSVIGPDGAVVRRIGPASWLGFLTRVRRTGPAAWQATIRFPRPGRWQLIVPNWCAPGYASPLPLLGKVTVR